MDKTTEAVHRQVAAMGCEVFDVGLFDPNDAQAPMVPRTWDADTLLRSVPWLRHQNWMGRNIYTRPHGEHNLTLLDDLQKNTIPLMKESGFAPACVMETSPGNFQAWIKHPHRLSKEFGTAAARLLAEKFGGDHGSADWRHFGRLSGLTNRKPKYKDPKSGLYPFVLLHEATGQIYSQADQFLAAVEKEVAEEHKRREEARKHWASWPTIPGALKKTIDDFRNDPKYGASETRQDLAYAIYAFAHGATEPTIAAALRSRDLSHKGNERRQGDYVNRTIRKALESIGGLER